MSSTPLQRKDVRITYRIEAPRTDVSIGLGKAEDRYLGISTLDNDASTASVGFGRSVSMRLRWGLSLYDIERRFNQTVIARADENDRIITAWVDRALGRGFHLLLVVSRFSYQGGSSLHEDRAEVRFSYSPTNSATAALPIAGR